MLRLKKIVLFAQSSYDMCVTSIYSTPIAARDSKMLLDDSKLMTPPDPTGVWSISQGDFIKILFLLCSPSEELTTGNFSSSKSQTCKTHQTNIYVKKLVPYILLLDN